MYTKEHFSKETIKALLKQKNKVKKLLNKVDAKLNKWQKENNSNEESTLYNAGLNKRYVTKRGKKYEKMKRVLEIVVTHIRTCLDLKGKNRQQSHGQTSSNSLIQRRIICMVKMGNFVLILEVLTQPTHYNFTENII